MKTGYASLPLHGGRAPRWLFSQMVRLSRQMTFHIVEEYGPGEFLRRLSDPFWFQALGCVLGFDWHSSGLTTTTCGALKVAVKGLENELSLWVTGGKGATSRKTPAEVVAACELTGMDPHPLMYASRMSAKVDSAAVQDGYQIYHHSFFFDRQGHWCVVQQGMHDSNGMARRYHWLSDQLESFVCEPHAAVCCDSRSDILNLVARESVGVRTAASEISCQHPRETLKILEKLPDLRLPRRHSISTSSDISPTYLKKILLRTYDRAPVNFEALLGTEGVGAKTLRALTLISELVYGQTASVKDPARFAFTHGGKDGVPYPVDLDAYRNSTQIFERALIRARLGRREELEALKRLHSLQKRVAQSVSG